MKQKTFIVLENWQIKCHIGTTPKEQKCKQTVILCVKIEEDSSRAVKSDMLADALDYQKVKNDIEAELKRSRFNLLETLAYTVINRCFLYKDVKSVYVKAKKPGAVGNNCEVSIEMEMAKK